jgi:hypothetical protein
MTVKVSQIRDELADREAIKQCLYRYSRGTDRCDVEMLRSAYWEDAVDNHLTFEGTREEFIAWAMPILQGMDMRFHMIGNIFIELRGDEAAVESYYWGFHRIRREDGSAYDVVGSGRYVDRFEKRDDEWRIGRRIVMTDWFREYEDSADWSKGMMGLVIDPGGKFPDDISYELFNHMLRERLAAE